VDYVLEGVFEALGYGADVLVKCSISDEKSIRLPTLMTGSLVSDVKSIHIRC
jgi:hypothetical protein